MPSRRALLEIAAMLAPKAGARVAQAIDDPSGYARKYRQKLEERSMDAPDPWVALVDALEEHRVLASIDWKTGFPELRGIIDRLLGKKLAWKGKLEERSTLELLEIFGARLLREHGLVLTHFDISADAYQLALVPKAKRARLEKLAHDVEFFTGNDLKKFERARIAQEKRARAKEARDPLRQRQFVHGDGRVFIFWGHRWHDARGWHRGWSMRRTLLGEDWTLAKQEFREDGPPKIARGFVEVTQEEWVARDASAKRRRRA